MRMQRINATNSKKVCVYKTLSCVRCLQNVWCRDYEISVPSVDDRTGGQPNIPLDGWSSLLFLDCVCLIDRCLSLSIGPMGQVIRNIFYSSSICNFNSAIFMWELDY